MPAMDYGRIADLYDSYVQVDLDIPYYLDAAKGAAKVLELMSGTGRISLPLAQAGVDLTCVDSSAEMLAYLRQKAFMTGAEIKIARQDVAELDLGATFDLILLPFNSFSEITDPAQQAAALKAIAQHLAPGGTFICTMHNPKFRLQPVGQGLQLRAKIPADDRITLLWVEENYNPEVRIVSGMQFVEVYDAAGVMMEKRFVEIAFVLHDLAVFEEMLADAGFEIKARYGNYQRGAFDPETSPYVIWELGMN
ncbi:class I SAM-dependent methyltransferase [bacterium]|nr:class I SAM-dependent methyltransferase [bacterium]